MSATSPRRSARSRAAGTTRPRRPCVVNGKWKAMPFGNVGQLMNWRTDWFNEAGFEKFPDTWDELLRGRHQAEGQGPSVRLRARPRLRRQPRLAVSAAVVLRRARGRARRQDRRDRLRRDRPRRRLLPASSSRRRCSRTCLGWTDVSNNKAWLTEQISCTNNAESILWVAKRDFPDIAKVTGQALNPQGPKGRFHILDSVEPFDLHPLRRTRGGEGVPALADGPEAARAAGTPRPTAITRRSCTSTTTRRCGTSSRATCRTAIRSRRRICPAGRRRSAAPQAESVAKYVVVDMFAKACAGESTKDVIIADADAQLKQIYSQA